MTHRTFIASILIAALAVTGMTSAPARAGNDDVAKWIAGVVTLGIIGAAIADSNKRDNRVVSRNRGYGHGHGLDSHSGHGRHGYQVDRRHLLPKHCRVRIRTHNDDIRGYSRRCLLNNYAHFNTLPHECAVRTRGNHGGVIYQRGCLKRYGYRDAERR